MAYDKFRSGGTMDDRETPFAVASFYPSEVGEIAEEMGLDLSPDELNAFCDEIADIVIDSLGAAMLEAGEIYIKAKLKDRQR